MQIFYSSEAKRIDSIITIEDKEHIHLAKVLRKRVGDDIVVANGRGLLFEGTIQQITKKKTTVALNTLLRQEENPSLLTLAVAPTKNMNRYEWMVEKTTEIGVGQIIPFLSYHSERKICKIERLKLISISAMKQSKQLYVPFIDEMQSFKSTLNKAKDYPVKLIAYCREHKRGIEEYIQTSSKVFILIGPEGGFSEEEVEMAEKEGFIAVTLGQNRLRTETAAIVAATLQNIL